MTDFNLPDEGVFIGRIWSPEVQGPSVVTLRDGKIVDITSKQAPTVRDICEMDDPAAYVRGADGVTVGDLASLAANPARRYGEGRISWRRATCRRSRPAA
jgi:fumarylacetoacetate (FAA) hydrolase family protein